MSLEKLVSLASRLFFLGAFVLLALAVLERSANAFGYTMFNLRGGRLLELAVVLLVFVIAMQMRELREELKRRRP
jgi:preprotein translocase subunit SecY